MKNFCRSTFRWLFGFEILYFRSEVYGGFVWFTPGLIWIAIVAWVIAAHFHFI